MVRRKRAANATDTAAIDRLLDQLDEGLANGDQAQMEGVLSQVLDPENALIPGVLAQRLIDGRVRVPGFAFELLAGLGGPMAPDHFARIAAASEADDTIRFGAQRRLGWPEQGENRQRLAFLDTLRDADGALLGVATEGAAAWPQNSETAQEVLGYLAAMPAKRRLALATRLAEDGEAELPWLLHALLHAADKGTQRLALRALAESDFPDAAGALTRFARTTGDDRLRAEATAAADRLAALPVEPEGLPPVDQALLSMLDGDGGQVALVVRQLGEGICLVVNMFHNEESGIKGVFGSAWLPQAEAEAMIESLEDGGIAMIGVPLAAVRGALAGALELNAARRTGLPPAYEVWEPLLHDAFPPAPGEPTIATILDDAPYAGRADLVAHGDRLFAHPFFQHWGFAGEAVFAALATIVAPSRAELTERELRPLIVALATPDARARFRARLRRQAWLLDHLEDATTRDLALASAAALASDDPATLAALPFLRQLVTISLQQAMRWSFYE